MLNQQTINIIKSTVPVLEKHGLAITTHFYKLLFENHPELWNVFNHANQKRNIQQQALADSLHAAAVHIDKLEQILPVVKKVAHKHRSIGVKAEHYPIVGHFLLLAMKDVLKDQATDEIIGAWGEAYGVIADIFIQVEADLYKQADWEDYQPLLITKKVEESTDLTSFYLQREDGKALAPFMAGQYVSVKIETDGYTHIRQYSLSSRSNESEYRISIKREQRDSAPDGVVSNAIHENLSEGDKLFVSAPAGTFTYDATGDAPLVLISAGSGITPLLAMLKELQAQNPERIVHFVHATKNSKTHAFKEEVEAIAASNSNVHSLTVYQAPLASDRFDAEGRIGAETLVLLSPSIAEAAVFISGSSSFLSHINTVLSEYGINDDQIHFESYQPQITLA